MLMISMQVLDMSIQRIAEAAIGFDQPCPAWIRRELASQPEYLNVDAAVVDIFVRPRRAHELKP
jgi:hypothetical protein